MMMMKSCSSGIKHKSVVKFKVDGIQELKQCVLRPIEMATRLAELTKIIDRWRLQSLHIEEDITSHIEVQCFANNIKVTGL